jgi:protein-tyrosine phosphatase
MKILMVCLGNICRSPLAHGLMQAVALERGLQWQIESAGTGDWHVGLPPDQRSIEIAKKYGIDIAQQRAQQFKPSFFDQYDLILVMDRNNLRDVTKMARDEADRQKIRLFLETEEVQDPYYDDHLFQPVFLQIRERCNRLIEELLEREH